MAIINQNSSEDILMRADVEIGLTAEASRIPLKYNDLTFADYMNTQYLLTSPSAPTTRFP